MSSKRRTTQDSAETRGRLTQLTRAGWHRTARKLATCATCALVIGSLAMPNAALAAEWLEVGGSHYDAGTAAGDDAGTWSWDGANDLQLNGYDGDGISAAGKLDVTYTGENNITSDDDHGIGVEDGENEDAELTITGDGTLNVESKSSDAIRSDGDLAISGSGNVNATGYYDGLHAGGGLTIDSTGTVVANGATRSEEDEEEHPSGYGISAGDDLFISGGGTIEASGMCDSGIRAEGNVTIEESKVSVSSSHDAGILAEGTLTIAKKALVTASGTFGVWAYEGVTVDNSTLKATGIDEGDYAAGILSDEGYITIRNGSHVEAYARGQAASAIDSENYTYNYDGRVTDGGRISISDSTVSAVAELIPDAEGEAFGIIARNTKLDTPASIDIVNSNVTASGESAAMLAIGEGRTPDVVAGAITITDSTIALPTNGLINDLFIADEGEEPSDTYYFRGQIIGTADDLVSDLDNEAIARNVTITANKKAEEEEPGKPEGDPKGNEQPGSGDAGNGSATVSQASTKKQGGRLPQTGDGDTIAAAAIAIAGVATVGAGYAVSRKRQ